MKTNKSENKQSWCCTVRHSCYMIWQIFMWRGWQRTTLKAMIIHVFITAGKIKKQN